MNLSDELHAFESIYPYDSDLKYALFNTDLKKYIAKDEYQAYENVRQMTGRLNKMWYVWCMAREYKKPL